MSRPLRSVAPPSGWFIALAAALLVLGVYFRLAHVERRVARFDEVPTPYAVVSWDRVLFLDSLDAAAITTFRDQSADRGPEPECQNAVPGASPSAAPSASPAP